ncbi:MAG: DUF4255 domain-containing protein [Pseudomonadota bacterium]
MSVDALRATTLAFQRLLHSAVATDPATGALTGAPNASVYIGPPLRQPEDVGNRQVSLYLFHLEPNREMRNASRYVPPPADGSSLAEPASQDALALDLRYLVTAHRQAGSDEPNELRLLGQILATIQGNATLGGALLPGQEVRLTPEPYPMEELSRIWGLFPNEPYRTSMVYLASPVFVDARVLASGGPVTSRRVDAGTSAATPDVLGQRAGVEA